MYRYVIWSFLRKLCKLVGVAKNAMTSFLGLLCVFCHLKVKLCKSSTNPRSFAVPNKRVY